MVQYSTQLDGVFAALSDPTRRDMIARLSVRPHTVTELAEPHRMSLPAVAKHIRVLEQAGLLQSVKIGRARQCRLSPEPLAAAAEWIAHHHEFWEHRLDALDQYLARQQEESRNE